MWPACVIATRGYAIEQRWRSLVLEASYMRLQGWVKLLALHLVIERAKASRRLARDIRCMAAPCLRAYSEIDQLYADLLSLVMQADKGICARDNGLELRGRGSRSIG
jgi:hypothetical protein